MEFDFTSRAVGLKEYMDDPGCDSRMLFNTYREFAAINRLVSGWRAIYRRWLRPAMETGGPYHLLDIGFGGGDIARALNAWASADGFLLRVTGIEQDPRALQFVQESRWPPGIEFRLATTRELLTAGEKFDFVISNAVLHHLDDAAIAALVSDSVALSRRVVIHNDLRRSRVAYSLFRIWAGAFYHDSFALPDGLVSLRRSLTAPEMKALLPADWKVVRMFPFRLLAVRTGRP